MKFADLEKFKFKLRSLPNSKTFPRYLDRFVFFMAIYFIYNFITICLFYDGFALRTPTVFILAFPIIFLQLYSTIEYEFRNVSRDKIKDTIIHIRLGQTQSLIETLEENPEILKATYNKKSLLYWARHHQNIEANTLIIDMMKKSHRS